MTCSGMSPVSGLRHWVGVKSGGILGTIGTDQAMMLVSFGIGESIADRAIYLIPIVAVKMPDEAIPTSQGAVMNRGHHLSI